MQQQEANIFKICLKPLCSVFNQTVLQFNSPFRVKKTFLTNSIYSNVSNNEIKYPKLFRKLLQLCQTWHAHVTPYWFIF